MTSSSKKSAVRATRAKAAKPELSPLAPHLAALLNPALVEPAAGFEEAAQALYDLWRDHGALLPTDVEKHGLDDGAGGDETRNKGESGGVQATIDSLDQLLRLGDPNIRDKEAWTPHRPERPQKSEGGVKFELVSEYQPCRWLVCWLLVGWLVGWSVGWLLCVGGVVGWLAGWLRWLVVVVW